MLGQPKAAGVMSLPAHLWTSTEIFCHLVMQWRVLQVIAIFVVWKGENVDFNIIQSGLIRLHLVVQKLLTLARNTTLSVLLDSIFTDSPFDFQPYHEAIRGASLRYESVHASQPFRHSSSQVPSWISMPGAMTSFARWSNGVMPKSRRSHWKRYDILKVKEAMTGSRSFSCHAHGVGISSGCAWIAWINLCGLTANKQTALVQPGSWSFNNGRAMRTCSVSRRPWLQEITWCSWQIIRQKPIHRWERNEKIGKESKVF